MHSNLWIFLNDLSIFKHPLANFFLQMLYLLQKRLENSKLMREISDRVREGCIAFSKGTFIYMNSSIFDHTTKEGKEVPSC